MYFAVISAMRTQATSGCKLLAKYFASVVDFSTWCLVHWNAEVPPTSGFDQSCFADRSRFIIGPILVWYGYQPTGSCCFSPYGWEFMLIPVRKTQKCGSILKLQFSFLTKTATLLTRHILGQLIAFADMISDFL